MAAVAEKCDYLSVEDYLAGEEISDIKHEYVDGQVYAMAGAKVNHNRIARNMSALLWNHLRHQPCEPLSGDMLVKTFDKRFRYPDVVEQDFAEIEVQRRSVSWQSTYYFLGDEVVLESVNATLSVEAIYERVQNDDMLAWLEQQISQSSD